MNPDEIIMKAARELGIQQYVSISPWRETNTVVLVAVEPGNVSRCEITFHDLIDESLAEVKKKLLAALEKVRGIVKPV